MTRNEQLLNESYLIALEKNSMKAGYDYLLENGYEFEKVNHNIKNKNRVYMMLRNGVKFELGKKDGAKYLAYPLDGGNAFMISKQELEHECTKLAPTSL